MRPAALILTHTQLCSFSANALYRIGACLEAVPHALDRRLLSTGKKLEPNSHSNTCVATCVTFDSRLYTRHFPRTQVFTKVELTCNAKAACVDLGMRLL